MAWDVLRSLWRDDRPTRAKSFSASGAMIVLREESWMMSGSRCCLVGRDTPLGDVSKNILRAKTTIIHARGVPWECGGSWPEKAVGGMGPWGSPGVARENMTTR